MRSLAELGQAPKKAFYSHVLPSNVLLNLSFSDGKLNLPTTLQALKLSVDETLQHHAS